MILDLPAGGLRGSQNMTKITRNIRGFMLVAISICIGGSLFGQSISGSKISNDSSSQYFNFTGNFVVFYSYIARPITGTIPNSGSSAVVVSISDTLSPSETKNYADTLHSQALASAIARSLSLSQGIVSSVAETSFSWSFTNQGYTQLQTVPPSSTNALAVYSPGATWTPSFTGGSGGSTNLFCLVNYINWQSSPCSIPALPGIYTFYVASKPLDGYSGNNIDPLQGALSINFTPYTLTVTAPAEAPTSYNATIPAGSSFIPSYIGGTGGIKMWVVAGYTNWQSAAWTPTQPGTYYFYVATKADDGYTGNYTDPSQGLMQENYTAYQLTVTP